MCRASAFTLVEALALSAVLGVGSAGLVVANHQPQGDEPLGKARASARQIKCATQLRNISQALVVFAQNNKDVYPLPSKLDPNNTTIALAEGAHARSKDTTGGILSILLWNGMISPEICVSPSEANAKIKVDAGYEFAKPAGAAKPDQAMWDPKFAGTPDDASARTPGVGNNSYAHTLPLGQRQALWSSTFNSTEAVLGNRGPGYQRVTKPRLGWTLNPSGATPPGADSITLKIHGKPNTWEGNIAYNDCHVNFETRPDPIENTYRRLRAEGDAGDLVVPDNLFENEADDLTREGKLEDPYSGTNNWLVMVSAMKVTEGKPAVTMFKD